MRRQPVINAIHHIEEMWTTLIRVRDDIKESVRLAADKTLQALSKSCIKVNFCYIKLYFEFNFTF